MTSEVVTNAVVHGSGRVTFRLDVGVTSVRVEVGDDDPQTPRVTAADLSQESGRGMVILDALAAAWGVCSAPPGKVVWFEVPVQP